MGHLFSIASESQAAALRARDRFLSAHPELRKLQQSIDRKMRNAAGEHNRLVLIHHLMMDSFREMNRKLHVLVGPRGKRDDSGSSRIGP